MQKLTFELANKYKVFLLDCDGVIWKGSEAISGVASSINYLKSIGKKFFYVTNNSTKTREQFVQKLRGFGVNAEYSEVVTSSSATAHYLKNQGFSKKVYFVGEIGISEELKKVGIESFGLEDTNKEFNLPNLKELPEDIGSVVVGLDTKVSYLKLSKAVQYLREKDENNQYKCQFIATNTDVTFPYNEGKIVPGAGSIVSIVELASERKADVIIGKPYNHMIRMIQEESGCDIQDMIMVGDRLETDILFGNQNHISTLCVLTGITNMNMIEKIDLNDTIQIPSYIIDSFASVGQLFSKDI
ncbi:hypothetical protein WA158_003774 [Blastocystis sp. Blastoise]